MKRFLLVGIGDDMSLVVIPNIWVTVGEDPKCAFPNYKCPNRIKKAVKRMEEADQSWILYTFKVYYESDDYDECHKRLGDAQYTSDLQSSDGNLEGRKRIRMKRRRSSSASSSEENVPPSPRKVPSPPPFTQETSRNSLFASQTQPGPNDNHFSPQPHTESSHNSLFASQPQPGPNDNHFSPQPHTESFHERKFPRPLFPSQPRTSYVPESSRNSLFASQTQPGRNDNHFSPQPHSESFHEPEFRRPLYPTQPRTSYVPESSRRSQPQPGPSNALFVRSPTELKEHGFPRTPSGYPPMQSKSRQEVFQEKVLKLLETLNNRVKDLDQRFEQFERNLVVLGSNPETLPPGCPELPINDVDVLAELEIFLKVRSNLDCVCSLLATTGGYSVKDCTRRILQRLISNPLSTKYNWKGSRGAKLAFCIYINITKLICGAVRRNNNCSGATDMDVLACIKNWLMHSGDRDGGRAERKAVVNMK